MDEETKAVLCIIKNYSNWIPNSFAKYRSFTQVFHKTFNYYIRKG